MKRAIVLGGGTAGLAAAFALRDRGLEVELCESRPQLGGRAFSVPNKGALTRPIDNGPHVILGCYDNFLRLVGRIGTAGEFAAADALRLVFADRSGVRSELRLGRLPTAVAMPLAILRFGALPFGMRLRVLRAMVGVAFSRPGSATLAEWIEQRGQHGLPRSYFWDPLCRSIMNAEAEAVSAGLFLTTLKRAFMGSARRAAIRVPLRPWSEVLGQPATRQLEREGITLRLRHRATRFVTDSTRVREIEFGDVVRTIDADTVLFSALPWHALARLTGESIELESAPIVSVYFEFADGTGLPQDPVVSLVDGYPFHFYCRTPGAPSGSFAVLSGGCRDFDGMQTAAIETLARAQLREHFPAAAFEGGTARVVKENHATFVGSPAAAGERLEPGRHPHVENLWVCGDWTAIGLPSTLEGAAASGYLAVDRLK